MSTSGALWLFDLGNSRLKGRCSHGGCDGEAIEIAWEAAGVDSTLRESLAAWPEPARVLVASVVSAERAAHLRAALRGWPASRVDWLVSPRAGCGIVNGYRRPERLGIDRFLAMAGARAASAGAAVLVVGCGTALTLDAVDGRGRHCEGLIAPSPGLMIRALRGGTAIADTNPDAFRTDAQSAPDDTREAIHAGCWRAAVALVSAFRARHRRAFGDCALWLHGGGAAGLQAAVAGDAGVDARLLDDAVWRGMKLWAAAPSVPEPAS